MSYQIYGAAGSGSAVVEAALELMAQPYQVIAEAPVWQDQTERNKVLPVNPLAQIPVLRTAKGEIITESSAILLWLTEQHPQAGLAPAIGSPERAQFLRWMSYIPAAIYSMYWVRDVPSRLVGDDVMAQQQVLVRTSERIAFCWQQMASQLTPGQFLLGDNCTVLDLYVAVVSRWTPRRQRFYQVAPNLADVVKRVDALPQLQQFWAKRFPFDEGWQG